MMISSSGIMYTQLKKPTRHPSLYQIFVGGPPFPTIGISDTNVPFIPIAPREDSSYAMTHPAPYDCSNSNSTSIGV